MLEGWFRFREDAELYCEYRNRDLGSFRGWYRVTATVPQISPNKPTILSEEEKAKYRAEIERWRVLRAKKFVQDAAYALLS